MNTSDQLRGVLPVPTGSEVRRLSTEAGNPINNGNIEELCSENGIYWIRKVIENTLQAGTTIGGTSTFRITDQRGVRSQQTSEMQKEYRKWNEDLVRIALRGYRELPVLGNIAPITNTSKSDDDELLAQIGDEGARIEYTYLRHNQQIQILANGGVSGILCEAFRHVEDALGAARASHENGIETFCASFEIDDEGIPGGYSLEQIREKIRNEMADGADILVGANCIGSTKVAELLETGETPGIAYPNTRDSKLFLPLKDHDVKNLSTAANEWSESRLSNLISEIRQKHTKVHIPDDRDELVRWLDETGETSNEALQNIWDQLLNSGTRIIGICCGGQPEHVKAAAEVWKNAQKPTLVKN